MVVEKLIPKKGKREFPIPNFVGSKYRHSSDTRIYHYQYEYWYDGRLFLLGKFEGKGLSLVDAETGAFAVSSEHIQGKPTTESVIEKFKELLLKTGASIHEVVSNYKKCNLDLELWLTNSLII